MPPLVAPALALEPAPPVPPPATAFLCLTVFPPDPPPPLARVGIARGDLPPPPTDVALAGAGYKLIRQRHYQSIN